MNNLFNSAISYVRKNQKKVFLNTILALILILLVSGPALYYAYLKKVTYEPTKACDLLTVEKAGDILGDRVINVEKNQPILSEDNNLATSKCAFSDSNPDTTKMRMAALAVQSAINDEGIEINKADFHDARTQDGMEKVEGVGIDAYFNPINGQLNILEEKRWIIFSIGLASAPENNDMKDVKSFARDLLE